MVLPCCENKDFVDDDFGPTVTPSATGGALATSGRAASPITGASLSQDSAQMLGSTLAARILSESLLRNIGSVQTAACAKGGLVCACAPDLAGLQLVRDTQEQYKGGVRREAQPLYERTEQKPTTVIVAPELTIQQQPHFDRAITARELTAQLAQTAPVSQQVTMSVAPLQSAPFSAAQGSNALSQGVSDQGSSHTAQVAQQITSGVTPSPVSSSSVSYHSETQPRVRDNAETTHTTTLETEVRTAQQVSLSEVARDARDVSTDKSSNAQLSSTSDATPVADAATLQQTVREQPTTQPPQAQAVDSFMSHRAEPSPSPTVYHAPQYEAPSSQQSSTVQPSMPSYSHQQHRSYSAPTVAVQSRTSQQQSYPSRASYSSPSMHRAPHISVSRNVGKTAPSTPQGDRSRDVQRGAQTPRAHPVQTSASDKLRASDIVRSSDRVQLNKHDHPLRPSPQREAHVKSDRNVSPVLRVQENISLQRTARLQRTGLTSQTIKQHTAHATSHVRVTIRDRALRLIETLFAIPQPSLLRRDEDEYLITRIAYRLPLKNIKRFFSKRVLKSDIDREDVRDRKKREGTLVARTAISSVQMSIPIIGTASEARITDSNQRGPEKILKSVLVKNDDGGARGGEQL
jgi:hypothetical protein